MTRLGVVSVATMVVVLAYGGCDSADEPDRSARRRPASSPATTTPSNTVDGRFIPPTSIDGSETVMPVTLPNGHRFELRYPTDLDLAVLGFKPVIFVDWPVRPDPLRCCGKAVGVTYQSLEDAWRGEPIATYRGADGSRVSYYHANAAGRTVALDYLVFQFGPWLVEAHDLQRSDPRNFEDRMTEDERETWARNLQGRSDPSGFLVLDAQSPLTLGPIEHFVLGPTDDGLIEVAGEYCGAPEADGPEPRYFPDPAGAGAAWCDPETGLHVSVTGPEDFVNGVVNGFQISPSSQG
jgi:hypothetical protein